MAKVTYHFRDAEGNTMGVYEQPGGTGALTLKEHTIYSSGRLGLFYRQEDRYTYELTDHLGNARAVIDRRVVDDRDPPTDLYPVMSFLADYYPFGWMMPDRKQLEYRYGYQGNEEDPETGWTAFQLRMYDGRIGRWMSVDPYGQYHSPYLAMGNMPMMRIDPDGGKDGPPSRFRRFLDGAKNIFRSPENRVSWEKDGAGWHRLVGGNIDQDYEPGLEGITVYGNANSYTEVGSDDKWLTQLDGSENQYSRCKITCDLITGATTSFSDAILTTALAPNGRGKPHNPGNGVRAIESMLKNGYMVIVGVDFQDGSSNLDGHTDHFVVIRGAGYENGNRFYTFFEVGTGRIAMGISPLNRFYLQSDSSLLGRTQYKLKREYLVTQVRPVKPQ